MKTYADVTDYAEPIGCALRTYLVAYFQEVSNVQIGVRMCVRAALCGQRSRAIFTTSPCRGDEGNTNNKSWFSGRQERVCEVRRIMLPPINGPLRVSGKNGGIEVIGEERQDIALEAQIIASGSSRNAAESVEQEVKIVTTDTIHAEGPQAWGWFRPSWSVSYRLEVPLSIVAQLHTENGGIRISNLIGVITADTTNGGLTLDDLAGEVHASTVNGSLDVKLIGSQWRGAGLFASTTNGGVSVKAPHNYSAHLVAKTVNGGIFMGFPISMQGNIGRHIETDIGQGGATINFQTVNGRVAIQQN